MSLTYSNMMALGEKAPDFSLIDSTSQNRIGINDVLGTQGLVVMFICVHCPYVIHVQDEIASLANEYNQKGIGFVAISSNDIINYPEDSPEKMKIQAAQVGFGFPYLYDHTQEIAKAYQAACTPDFFLFDKDLKCFYRGRMDESTPGNGKPNDGKDLRNAMDALLEIKAIPDNQFPSMGCNIKWFG